MNPVDVNQNQSNEPRTPDTPTEAEFVSPTERTRRSGAAILPLMAGSSLLVVLAIGALGVAPTSLMLGAAFALLVAVMTGGVAWLMRLLAEGDQLDPRERPGERLGALATKQRSGAASRSRLAA